MNNEVEKFLNALFAASLINKEDFGPLSKYPTPEDIFESIEVTVSSKIKLAEVYAKFRDLPFVQIHSIDRKAIDLIDRDLARRFGFIPFFIDERHKILQVAVTDPRKLLVLNRERLNELGARLNYRIEVMMASKDQVENALLAKDEPEEPIRFEKIEPQTDQPEINDTAFRPSESMDEKLKLGQNLATLEAIKSYASSGSAEELIGSIISFALARKASDIHVEPFERAIKIRIRVDGMMEEVIDLPDNLLAPLVSKIKIFSKLKIEEERVPQDGKLEADFGGHAIDIRVATLPTIFGEKITMRLLPKSKSLADLKALGLDGVLHDRLEAAINLPYGVVIMTGPTGSGKTTTVYSILNKLNKPETDIITIEDTIEYELENINQVKIQPQLGFGFAEGLRSSLKQDPNIIYLGEILEKETAELVCHAALTGRKVLTTLHTNDASEALPRLANLGVEPFLLASSVKCVVAQRLVRKLCQKCKEETELSASIKAELQKELDSLNLNLPFVFYRARGCEECQNGYSGRIGIFEVLPIDSKIEELVINRKSSKEILAAAKQNGFITIRQDGYIKALKGLTTIDEVIRATTMMDN
jgi:type II secretory ATPase GspE/PulE/Tfp pilus assembly ATPase PilB-like protein